MIKDVCQSDIENDKNNIEHFKITFKHKKIIILS